MYIGRKVYFKQEWMETKDWEYGIITSFNDSYVFVRYGSQQTSKSTIQSELILESNESKLK